MADRYVIFDCDGGSDDAWALLMLLKAEQVGHLRLLAVTLTGCGNTTLKFAARNMRRILHAKGRWAIPIYGGAEESLVTLPEDQPRTFFHGVDGFGDISDLDDDATEAELADDPTLAIHAATAIKQLCEQYPKKVTIIVVGPLTNLALCYSMYGRAFGKILKDIYIMGGNHQGVGNSTRCAEFNFHSDPEAAHAVLEKSQCPITILPWEACMEDRFNITINWRMEDFGVRAAGCNAIKLLNKVEKAQWEPNGYSWWCPCDAMLIAAYLYGNHIVRKQRKWHATVDLKGTHTRGQMVLDHLRQVDKYPENVGVIELLDAEFFKQIIEWVGGLREDFLGLYT